MEDTLTVSFSVTPETKEQLDQLYRELNRPVTHDELFTLLLQTYYRKTAETAFSRQLEIAGDRLGNELGPRPEQSYDESPQVRVSGRPMYTKRGVWYSPVEPRVSR